jgi:two-component system sensor histidine kinase PilS (NtrC family)
MMPNFRRRLLWLIGGRAVVVTLLLGSAILMAEVSAPGSLPIDAFFFLIGLTYALTLVYVLLLKQAERHPWLVDVQLAADAVIVSALVYMTNGVASYFTSLYALPIIAASTIQSQRSGMTVGVLSSLMYATIVAAQYSGTLTTPIVVGMDLLPPRRIAFFIAGLNIFGFMAVAGLSGYLAERLRRAGVQLEETSNQLEDLQAFSDHVISSLQGGLATTDIDGSVLSFNKAAEVITGVPAGQAVARPAMGILQLPPEFAEMFGTRAEERLRPERGAEPPSESERGWGPASAEKRLRPERGAEPPSAEKGGRRNLPRVEYVFTCADGRQLELGISTAILTTPRGEVGFVFTFQDVTEARRQEREARIQQRLAAVGEMAAGIAHEIRNPLASMSGSLQILRQELPLSDEQSQLMDIVLRESDRLNDTIRSFLAYARPLRSSLMRLDIRQVLTDTGTLLQNSPELMESHSIQCDVPSEPVWCLADEAQIRQILWNLATNGLRAMPDGGRLTLAASSAAAAGVPAVVLIAVSDEGIGIDPQELDGILQPFHGGFARGTGLGLSIVHRIVSDYGGELLVASQPGKGTTVTVKLSSAETAAVSSQPPAIGAEVERTTSGHRAAESRKLTAES